MNGKRILLVYVTSSLIVFLALSLAVANAYLFWKPERITYNLYEASPKLKSLVSKNGFGSVDLPLVFFVTVPRGRYHIVLRVEGLQCKNMSLKGVSNAGAVEARRNTLDLGVKQLNQPYFLLVLTLHIVTPCSETGNTTPTAVLSVYPAR